MTDENCEAFAIRDSRRETIQEHKLKPGPGHSQAEVSASQLARLHRAMVELVDEVGYEAVTVRMLARSAEVSTRTFYEYFKGKQDCLLATHTEIMQRAAHRAAEAQRGEEDWRECLRLALGAFADELADDPPAARLALVEVSGAGLAVLDRMKETAALFEGMLARGLTRAPGSTSPSPLIVKAIAAGIVRTARARVLAGAERELPALVDSLLAWVLCLQGEVAAEFGHDGGEAALRPASGRLPRQGATGLEGAGERQLLLSAATNLAAREGYWGLSGARISAEAGLSPRSFSAHFEDAEACFLACLELLNDRALAFAEQEGRRLPDWPSGVHHALGILAGYSARHPSLARLAFVEVFAPGTRGLRQREQLLGVVTERFRASAPPTQRPGRFAAEASIGAIWAIVHHYVSSGREERLPALAPLLSFLALAPAIGGETAAHVICTESREAVEPRYRTTA